MDFYSK